MKMTNDRSWWIMKVDVMMNFVFLFISFIHLSSFFPINNPLLYICMCFEKWLIIICSLQQAVGEDNIIQRLRSWLQSNVKYLATCWNSTFYIWINQIDLFHTFHRQFRNMHLIALVLCDAILMSRIINQT